MSSAKRVWPVTLARPSTRRRGLPRTFIAHPLRRLLDGLEDLLVAGAAAQVAGHCFLDSLAGGIRLFRGQRLGGEQDAGGAVAALGGAEVGESGLQRMELCAAGHPLHSLHRAPLALDRQHQAGELRLAVDEDCAGTALAELAAVLGAGEAEVLAQQLEQRLVRREGNLLRLAVERESELHLPHCSDPKQSSRRHFTPKSHGGQSGFSGGNMFLFRMTPMTLRIGDTAPNFQAQTTEGQIDFHQWIGDKWVVLFSHPKDFTPVCTTELGTMAKMKPEFDKRGVKVIGLSADPVDDHKRWANDIKETQGTAPNYPMIGDSDLNVAKLYDMRPPEATP